MKARLMAMGLGALFAIGLASTAHATTQVGQIAVKVIDTETEEPIVGAAIELRSPELIGGKRVVLTREDGTYRFTQLPPGEYSLFATYRNYQPVKLTGIKVNIGATASIDIGMVLLPEDKRKPEEELEELVGSDLMQLLEVEEIVVSAAQPVVDTERLTLGGTINDTFYETVPTSRDYQGLAQLVPGVSGAGNPNVLGSTMYNNQYLLDGINITDPVTNTFSANFNFDAIRSLEVLTGARDAEYGNAAGGVLNIVTKSGSNEFELDSSVYYRSDALQIKGVGEEDLTNQYVNANINFGGPIVEDKLWFFVSGELPFNTSTIPDPEGGTVFPDRVDLKHPSREYLGFYGLAKLTYQMTEDQTFKLLIQGDPTNITNTRQDPSVHPDAEEEQFQSGIIIAAYSETFITPNLFFNNRLAFNNNNLDVHPQSHDDTLAGRFNETTGTYSVNNETLLKDERNRLQLHSSLAYNVDDFFGEHQIKGGIDVSLTWNNVTSTLPGGEFFYDSDVDPSDPNSISGEGLPSEVKRVIEAQETSIFGDAEAVFIQDVYKPIENVTIRAGLRYDSARLRNWEGETQVEVNTFSPRIGVAWDPFADGKTVLRAGYYQYVDTGYLALSDFAGGRSTLLRHYDYNAITGAYDTFTYEEGGEGGVVAKKYLKDSWDQRRPRTHEAVVGVARELVTDLAGSVNFIYRYYDRQWEDNEINLLWNEDGDQAIGYKDGERHYVYSLGALRDSFITYWGLQFTLRKRFSRNWEMLASYEYSETKGTAAAADPYIISVAFDRPRQLEYEYGNLEHDVRHILKVYGSYRFPYGIVAGGSVRYETGAPYNRKYYNSFFGDYEDLRAPRGHTYNADGDLVELRLPDTFTLNVRLMWKLEELTGINLDLIAEVYNVFNARTPIKYEERNLPAGGATAWGDTIDKLDPFRVQLGMRFRY